MLITNQIQLSFLFCPNHSSNNRNVIVYLPDFVPTSPACVVRIEELSSGAISSELPTVRRLQSDPASGFQIIQHNSYLCNVCIKHFLHVGCLHTRVL